MKCNKRNLLIFIAILIISVSCVIHEMYAFDKVPGQFKEFGDASGEDYYGRHRDPVYINLEGGINTIVVIGTAEGLYPDYVDGKIMYKRGSGTYVQAGSAFHIGNGYFVTAAHVVEPMIVQIQISKNVYYVVSIDKVLNRQITLGNSLLGNVPAWIEWIDSTQDLAIIRVDLRWGPLFDMEYRPAYTKLFIPIGFGGIVVDELGKDTTVAVIVRSRKNPEEGDFSWTWNYEVRYGRIISGTPILPACVPPEILSWFQPGDVTTDLLLYPGDSGSPVFAFKDGKPIIVGVARATVHSVCFSEDGEPTLHTYSYFSRIDAITIKSREIK